MSDDNFVVPGTDGVLKNRFGVTTHADLQEKEAKHTGTAILGMRLGKGPERTFDRAHLKAIHEALFKKVYDWAGTMRDEAARIDGEVVGRVPNLGKGESQFAHASEIDSRIDKAIEPIRDLETLRNGSTEEFANRAGDALRDINNAHPFREGNGRTQRVFIEELVRATGHDVNFRGITAARNIEASIEARNNPESDAMRHLMRDATDPARVAELIKTRAMLERAKIDPDERYVRTVRDGESLSGTLAFRDSKAGHVLKDAGLVLVDARDVPQLKGDNRSVSIKATHKFGAPSPDRAKEQGSAERQTPAKSRDDDGRGR